MKYKSVELQVSVMCCTLPMTLIRMVRAKQLRICKRLNILLNNASNECTSYKRNLFGTEYHHFAQYELLSGETRHLTLAVLTWARIMFRKTFRNVIRPFPDLKA